jgi:hypothetical protein
VKLATLRIGYPRCQRRVSARTQPLCCGGHIKAQRLLRSPSLLLGARVAPARREPRPRLSHTHTPAPLCSSGHSLTAHPISHESIGPCTALTYRPLCDLPDVPSPRIPPPLRALGHAPHLRHSPPPMKEPGHARTAQPASMRALGHARTQHHPPPMRAPGRLHSRTTRLPRDPPGRKRTAQPDDDQSAHRKCSSKTQKQKDVQVAACLIPASYWESISSVQFSPTPMRAPDRAHTAPCVVWTYRGSATPPLAFSLAS